MPEPKVIVPRSGVKQIVPPLACSAFASACLNDPGPESWMVETVKWELSVEAHAVELAEALSWVVTPTTVVVKLDATSIVAMRAEKRFFIALVFHSAAS